MVKLWRILIAGILLVSGCEEQPTTLKGKWKVISIFEKGVSDTLKHDENIIWNFEDRILKFYVERDTPAKAKYTVGYDTTPHILKLTFIDTVYKDESNSGFCMIQNNHLYILLAEKDASADPKDVKFSDDWADKNKYIFIKLTPVRDK